MIVELEGPKVKMPGSDILIPGRRERFTVIQMDNLVVVNLCPTYSKDIYAHFRTMPPQGKAKSLKGLLDSIAAKLKLSQSGVVIDRLEILASLMGIEETLRFVKLVKTGQKADDKKSEMFPFYAHVDFSLMSKDEVEQRVLKL